MRKITLIIILIGNFLNAFSQIDNGIQRINTNYRILDSTHTWLSSNSWNLVANNWNVTPFLRRINYTYDSNNNNTGYTNISNIASSNSWTNSANYSWVYDINNNIISQTIQLWNTSSNS
jgi:hypothetical protein